MNALLAPPAAAPFDLIAIVASAGGLDAVTAVLADLAQPLRAAVVIAQHLGAESALVGILARRTGLAVEWVQEGMELHAGRVYVSPPHTNLEVLPDRTCTLQAYQHQLLVERPLDRLLHSVADSFGTRALAIVLTGLGRDGAEGAGAVRAAGGAVLVQSEETAAYPEMPGATIQAGAADLVVPLGQIGCTVSDLMAGGRFPHPRTEEEARDALFGGVGAARAALRAVDWPTTPLGKVREWPRSLKAILGTMLHSRFPSCIFWGSEFLQLYNDAWISMLGDGHPAAAGLPARATWSELRAGPMGYRSVLQTGRASYFEDQLLEVNRHGFAEEACFTVSHSPVHDDQGAVQAVLTIATETTERVLAARRQGALHALASSDGGEGVAAACERTTAVLADIVRDIPFALVYLTDEDGLRANLCVAVGLRRGAGFAPDSIDLFHSPGVWPVARVLRQDSSLLLGDLDTRLGGFHSGPWPESPNAALLLPLRLGDGEPSGVLVAGLSSRLPFDSAYRDFVELLGQQVATTLTQARLRERQRERMAELSELDRTRTEFFSNISHEFRTPLTLILAPLEDLLASQPGESSPLRHELELASRNARRLLRLVDTLLDFSQIEAGRLRADFREVDLAALTADVAGLFRSAVERAGLELEVDCPSLPQAVRVDAGMWEKIVSNLLSNALKFTFTGCIAVRLRSLGQHVQLEVSDTGVGIPEAELAHLFRRFHRVRGTRARSEEGAGIGLALANELVHLHDGRIRVRSEPGQGTTFTVWLNAQQLSLRALVASPARSGMPRRSAEHLAEEAGRWAAAGAMPDEPGGVLQSVLGPASPALPLRLPRARLLVADGNADMREYLARTLGAHWDVILAADCAQALAEARRQRPDLVLADVEMSVLDGFALLHQLRAEPQLQATPLVLLTARTHEEAAIEGLGAGADDYIAKPFSSRELVARIGAQLELARVRGQGERQVRELLSLMPAGVYACDAHGRFDYWNRHAVELWGQEPDVEDRFWAIAGGPRAIGADGSAMLPAESPMAQVLRTGEALQDQQLAILRADGSRVELMVNIQPLHEGRQLVGAVAAFVDVGSRK
jgi:signal transduction histidine kinase/chemotaxis response regulator CheB